MRSLSRLMLVAMLGVVTLASVASGLAAWRSGLIEAGELFDAKLAHSARVLHGLVDGALDDGAAAPIRIAVWAGEPGAATDLATADGHEYETKLAFQAWSPDGRLLLDSQSAPDEALAPLAAGFHERDIEGQRWRSFALQAPSGRWYLAGEREDVRGDIAGDIALGILAPLMIELPVLALLIWLVILYGRRFLQRVTRQVAARGESDLQPLDDRQAPDEIRVLVQAINRLLGSLRGALDRERRFTADAAHELRTPISALRLQLANLREAGDAAQRQHAEGQLERGLRRLDRLVEQLLTLSRLEPGAAPPDPQDFDPRSAAREVLAELANAEPARAGDLALDAPAGALVLCADPTAFSILLRNLVDNALRYSAPGAPVRIGIERDARGILLAVEDGGPGIAENARGRVLDRFHRELGSGADGSGLGLSIVQRIADLHGASLRLDRSADLGGLRVEVRFPG